MCPAVVSEHTRSQAEVDLFGIISRELSDEWTVFHSLGLAIHDRKPWAEADFVLVGPKGVFVLEVKGKGVRRENGRWIYTTGAGRDSEPKAEGPFDQAGGASAALRHYLVDAVPGLRSSVVGFGVATPDIRFGVAGPDIIPEVIYDADDVGSPFSDYVARMTEYWHQRLAAMRGRAPSVVGERTHAAVVEQLRGDFDARPTLRARADQVHKELLRLTHEQYRVLDGLAQNRRAIIGGGAGTGKTLLAVEEAARFSRDGSRVLLVCYNRHLATFLKSVTNQIVGVTVASLHALMYDVVNRADLLSSLPSVAGQDLWDVHYPDLAYQALVEGAVEDRYDVVIVDEGQDLLTARYVDVIDSLLESGVSGGRWRVFYDPRQNLFSRIEASALARLRNGSASYQLTTNCRNTRPIGVATALLCGLTPGETLTIEGSDVTVRWYEDSSEQARVVARDVGRLLSGGFAPSDITIIGRRRLEKTPLAAGLAGVWCRLSDETGGLAANTIHYATPQSFKGLESDVVLVVDVDDLASPSEVDALYVATSRARTDLYVYIDKAIASQYEERARELGRHLAATD